MSRLPFVRFISASAEPDLIGGTVRELINPPANPCDNRRPTVCPRGHYGEPDDIVCDICGAEEMKGAA